MDVLAEVARTKPLWAMLFAYDLVLVNETVEEVQEELERWRAAIENKVLIISRSKTEYVGPSHKHGVVKLEGEPLPSVYSFKYLGSVLYGSGGYGKKVDGRIKVAKILRWRRGKTEEVSIRNETIRGIARVTPIKSVLTQTRLSWYGHVTRREAH